MGRKDTFSPVIWKTSEIKRKISSVKLAELFALDYGAGQLCYQKDLYGHFSSKPIKLTHRQRSIPLGLSDPLWTE